MDKTWCHHGWKEPDLNDQEHQSYQKKLPQDYRDTFETDHGRRVLRHLIAASGFLEMSTANTTEENLRREGAANMIKMILMKMNDGDQGPVIEALIDDDMEKMNGTDTTNDAGINVTGGLAISNNDDRYAPVDADWGADWSSGDIALGD